MITFKEKIELVLQKDKFLTLCGYMNRYNDGRGMTDSEYMNHFNVEQDKLYDYEKAFDLCVDMLEHHVQPVKNIPHRHALHSYYGKHIAEQYSKMKGVSCYVPNGVFIAAAIYIGYTYKVYDEKNAVFACSLKSVSKLIKMVNSF
jgi:hypothetical protein